MADQLSPDWLGLAGRVCVVTGAGGGIGRSVAVNLAKAGAQVAALDRDEQGLEKTRAELAGNRHVIVPCDVTHADSIAAAAATVEKALGPAQVLVNAAAILRPGALDTLSLAEWNLVLSINLTGYFLCAQTFGAQMRKVKRGSLVHVASIAASNAQGKSGAYSVSKAGVVMLSRQLAERMGTGRHPQQCGQPRHGDHADEPGVLRYAGGHRAPLGGDADAPHRHAAGHCGCRDVPRQRPRLLRHRRRDHRRRRLYAHHHESGAAAGARLRVRVAPSLEGGGLERGAFSDAPGDREFPSPFALSRKSSKGR